MDKRLEPLKEEFNAGKDIASDTSKNISQAATDLANEVKQEFAAASDYSQSRAERKQLVAKRLAETREAAGIKQRDAARQTGLNVITLSGYELGRNEANMEALVRLADLYEVSLDYLLCRTSEKIRFTKEDGRESRQELKEKLTAIEEELSKIKGEMF